jgi:hypothetical protein
VPVVAAGITFFAHPLITPVLVFDAAGLGLFCVTGTQKALDFGLGPLQAAVLGATTVVGGGVTGYRRPGDPRAGEPAHRVPLCQDQVRQDLNLKR